MSQVFQEHSHCYDKRKKKKKIKIMKIYLFLLPPLPSQEKGVVAAPRSPQPFFTAKVFENFFVTDLYIGVLTKGG